MSLGDRFELNQVLAVWARHCGLVLIAGTALLSACGGGHDAGMDAASTASTAATAAASDEVAVADAPVEMPVDLSGADIAFAPKNQPVAGDDALAEATNAASAESTAFATEREHAMAVATTAVAGPAPATAGAIGKFAIRHTFPGIEVASTPISLAYLNSTPAGSVGRITNVGGHLSVGGKRIRLYGINMPVGAFMPSNSHAKVIAARLAKEGFNAVRILGFDRLLAKPDTYTVSYLQQGVLNRNHTLNPLAMDKLDFFVDQLQRAGIYVSFPLHSSRTYLQAADCIDYCEGLDNYLPSLVQSQKDFAAAFVNHVNPYTGKAYRDDPGVFAFEINNENSLTHRWSVGVIDRYVTEAAYATKYGAPLQNLWRAWVQRKYGNVAAAGTAWGHALGNWTDVAVPLRSQRATLQTTRYRDWMDFMAETESGYKQQMSTHLRSTLKVTSLVYGTQSSYNQPFSRDGMDMGDLHVYFGDIGTKTGLINSPRNGFPVYEIQNKSAVDFADVKDAGLYGIFEDKMLGRPNIITEYAYRDGNQHAAEAEPLMGAFAGFQDLDALFLFNYHGMNLNTVAQTYPGWYNMTVNAVTRVATALAFRRGDVDAGEPQVLKKTRQSFLETIAKTKSTRVSNFHFGGNARAPYTRNVYTQVVDSPAQEQIVKGGDAVNGAFTTTTGQISWRPLDRITVDTPRSKMAIGRFTNDVVRLGSDVVVTVGRTMNNYAVMSLASLNDSEVLPSRRMLFSIAGHFTVQGEYPRKPGDRRFSWGNDVPRIEAVPATVRITTSANLVVTALDATGARKAKVPVTRIGSQLEFVTGPAYDTGWYLIEDASGAGAATAVTAIAPVTTTAPSATTTAPVVVASANVAPTVALSAPASATLGVPVNLVAAASDADGLVARVEFFDGTTLIGSDTTSPYSVSWTAASTGPHGITVRAIDNAGASKTSAVTSVNVAAAQTASAAVASKNANGLKAEYFANANLAGAPKLTRVEAPTFEWGTASPAAGLPADYWSVRWTGYVVIPKTGTYTFQVIADDGARVRINGSQMANDWTHSGNLAYTAKPVTLAAGTRLPVTLEHYDGTGGSTFKLRWKTPESGAYWPDVPLEQLVAN